MILFIDDEERRMESYVEELKEKYGENEVVFEPNIDDALVFFEEKHDCIKLLILDVMMPLGGILKEEETNYGLRTGIVLYDKIRKDNRDLPIIIFTNVTDEELENNINQDMNSSFLQKENYLPHELVWKVQEILES